MYTVSNTLLEYTSFTFQKTLLQTLLLLVFELVEILQCILKGQKQPKILQYSQENSCVEGL